MNPEEIKLSPKSEEFNANIEKMKGKIWIEMSRNDHESIGSSFGKELDGDTGLDKNMKSLEERMTESPDKSVGKLMTDEEIDEYLNHFVSGLKSAEEDLKNSKNRDASLKTLEEVKIEYRKILDYLRKIGKLPKAYEAREN